MIIYFIAASATDMIDSFVAASAPDKIMYFIAASAAPNELLLHWSQAFGRSLQEPFGYSNLDSDLGTFSIFEIFL